MLNPVVIVDTMVFRRPRFGWRDWLRVGQKVFAGIGEKRLSLLSAGVAFFGMLALFPALTAFIGLFGYVSDPVAVRENLTLLQTVIPDDVLTLIEREVDQLISARRSTLGFASIVSIILATVSTRAGVNALMMGLSFIGHAHGMRGFFHNMLVAYSLTLMLILVGLTALTTLVVVPTALALFPLFVVSPISAQILRWSITIFTVGLGIGVLYRFGPARRTKRGGVLSVGNIVATLLWILASVLFSLYLSTFANYSQVYGPLGAVIALLMWLYVSAFVVLLGAEVNAEIEAHGIDVILKRNPRLDGGDGAPARPEPDEPEFA
ncbi:YihY family inner membrane protein [Rhodobacteraceae bacterium 2CG4]|uniref:YihY family inner membrane protein n=1 Tax=Halovulum marinum TaxID=2662447 RepID=A0A6L5Z3J3_9RHOB|nr:YihY/virulence factor BrkB family protein [Halovulum marinum]MSU90650.1 YihY family inner membrane protein [Halovulum marinum]